MKKTLTRKFIYVLAAIAILAMLIPAMAVPVSAAPTLSMELYNPLTGGYVPDTLDGGAGYNVTGSKVKITATLDGWTLLGWSITNVAVAPPNGPAVFVAPTDPPGTNNPVYVQGTWGDAVISAILQNGTANQTITIEKKWGQIDNTVISAPGSSAVSWNEASKLWTGTANITDTVIGVFYEKDEPHYVLHAAQGTILNWYLVTGTAVVPMTPADANVLKPVIAGLPHPSHVNIANVGTWYTQTITGGDGKSSISLNATGEEAVQIVVIPEYPFTAVNIPVTPEVTSWDFYTTELEVVPQVRWAGEKIVLEKYWGPDPVSAGASFNNHWVKFSLQNQSVGALEGITGTQNIVNGGTVWVQVANGGSAVILTSSDTGVSNVVAAIYTGTVAGEGTIINQHYFTVYWLKFERLTLGDVNGKRLGHNTGLWDPPNPYLTATDNTTQTLNVSQDALLRARVTGWFVSSNPSVRPVRLIDPANSTLEFTPTAPGSATLTLPAGRWILPDDWAALAGPNWLQSRIHWDIMNTPDGTSGSYSGWNNMNIAMNYYGTAATFNYQYTAVNPSLVAPPQTLSAMNDAGNADGLGNYFKITTNRNVPPPGPLNNIKILYSNTANPQIAKALVIGPFSPGLELMLPNGWQLANPNYDPNYRNMDTTVPDGNLNIWDAPMPPAKIIFQIQKTSTTSNLLNAGFFKAAAKTDIYYIWMPDPNNPSNPMVKVYTNPFYQEMIPAHEAIPAFINNGGYDWNSFDGSYGPYMFWEFINQNRYLPIVTSSDPSGHPTVVEVYSDNHGEAMVWFNGNWNLDLSKFTNKGPADVPYMAEVGKSTIQATADYPYSRLHQAIQSNPDTKTLLWGGIVLGADVHEYGDLSFSNGQATRLVLSAGAYNASTIIGVYPNQSALSQNKVVWIFVSDRDNRLAGVNGAWVHWEVGSVSGSGAKIMDANTGTSGISNYNPVTKNIQLVNGFLAGTNGIIRDVGRTVADSILIPVVQNPPTAQSTALTALFNKFWGNGYTENSTTYPPTSVINGLNPANFAVAAVDIMDLGNSYSSVASVVASIHSHDFDPAQPYAFDSAVVYKTLVDFSVADSLDDAIRAGDANCDGAVNMGDVTATERMILGLDKVTSNAVLNSDGTVDMGTVVKIERSILGLK